jgi:hypothetical protein
MKTYRVDQAIPVIKREKGMLGVEVKKSGKLFEIVWLEDPRIEFCRRINKCSHDCKASVLR